MSDNAILAISARAAELCAQGTDVISLAAGEPDLPTPANVTAAAARAAADPAYHRYGSAAGLPELRSLAADRLATATGLPWNAEDIQITLGTKHALALALQAVLGPDEDVLVTSPGWPGHHGAVQAAGGRVRSIPVRAEDRFLATPQTLDLALTGRTRAVILASPGNPVGAVYPRELLADIADWALRHDVWIIADDIYDQFVYDGPHTTLLAAAPRARDRCIVVNGVSKAHAMTGWRIGWLAGPASVVAHAFRNVSQTITHVPLITQAAAIEALAGDQRPLHEARTRYRANRDLLTDALNTLPGIDCPRPSGGLYVFPSVAALLARHPERWTSAADVAAWLLDTAHVAAVPGEVFHAPNHLRLCFAVSDTAVREAIQRLCRAFETLT
ncbi:aminotransferase class I/II-fold pyridoxal phosphate-dependent enzyme [Streptomyces sp. LBL]|uniref:aminotransferase class I/II-fold pyridoxal phosphate-dependent enzyme n=1 Tax=Streptomyces sp. LBL TaxID=2940562 RepID=UPI002473EA89|nr:aminotransferase class I/II-fold pyridoxal phosphate-dependent enzyme [Streptomyces sp. LBL]